MDLKLPPQLAKCQDVFRGFYLAKYQGRRLFWQHSLGQSVVKSFFPKVLTVFCCTRPRDGHHHTHHSISPKGRKELAVSMVQTVVLLLFNDSASISYKDIAEETGIEQKEVRTFAP